MDTMRAMVIDGDGGVALGERPLPEPGAGDVRVRIEACGICGSDLHFLALGALPAGHTLGHECSGRIDAVGDGVDDARIGERVVVEPIRSCGACRYCRAGQRQICPEMGLLGIHHPGGLAEAVTAPAPRAHRIDDALPTAISALAEPVAVSVHALRQGGVRPGDRVLVLGAGTIGLTTTIAAAALGADVVQSARHAHQAEQALACGASEVLEEADASPDRIGVTLAGAEPDVVIETVGGHADTLVAAGRAVRPGGTIVVLGVFQTPPALDPFAMLLREARLVWSNCYGGAPQDGDFAQAIRLLDAESERLGALLTHTRPLDDVVDAFAVAADKSSGALKVTVTI